MFITIQQWLYNVIFRLASSKDSTNLSYKKKTEETVGVTLTVKVIKMIEDFFQVNRTTQVTIYLKSILDIVYKKPWILLKLLLCTSFNNDHVTYYVFIIAWTFHLHCLWIYYSITFRVIFSQRIILQLLNGYKNTKASAYSRENLWKISWKCIWIKTMWGKQTTRLEKTWTFCFIPLKEILFTICVCFGKINSTQ